MVCDQNQKYIGRSFLLKKRGGMAKSFQLLKRRNGSVYLSVIVVLLSVYLAVLCLNKKSSSSSSSSSTNTMKNNPKQEEEDASETETHIKEIFGVKIERNPPESKISLLGITSWPKWGCPPSKFPWTFTAKETMYLLEGKVKVYCEGYDGFFEIKAGDLVEFPNGMNVTWDVTEAVNKHYHLEK